MHIDEKGRENYDYSWGQMENAYWANIYVTYIPHSHWSGDLYQKGKIQPLTWGAYLRTRRKGCSQLRELNQYKLDGILECRALILPGWNRISWLWVQATVETAKRFVIGVRKDTIRLEGNSFLQNKLSARFNLTNPVGMVSTGRWNIRDIMYSWIIVLVYCLLFHVYWLYWSSYSINSMHTECLIYFFCVISHFCLLSNTGFVSYPDFNKTYWWNGANPLLSISCKTINAWLYQAGNIKHFLNQNICIRNYKN